MTGFAQVKGPEVRLRVAADSSNGPWLSLSR